MGSLNPKKEEKRQEQNAYLAITKLRKDFNHSGLRPDIGELVETSSGSIIEFTDLSAGLGSDRSKIITIKGYAASSLDGQDVKKLPEYFNGAQINYQVLKR